MKLMIELNYYERLKNIAKTADDKIRKVKRLCYVSCAMVYISVIGMICAIYFDETVLTIVFFILALLFSCSAIKILCDPNAYFKRICNMVQKCWKFLMRNRVFRWNAGPKPMIHLNVIISTKTASCRKQVSHMKKIYA